MSKVYVVSDDNSLYYKMRDMLKYSDFFERLEICNVAGVGNIYERNACIILNKADFEMDLLKLIVKRMYVILITDCEDLNIDIGDEARVLIVRKPCVDDDLYLAVRMILTTMKAENDAAKMDISTSDVRKAAETDYLTGLPNRRGLYDYFTLDLKTEKVHCMFMDIDNFKKVNDTYGHKMGDKLLVKVSHLIKDKVGDAFFARLSGDEFAVIIDGYKSKDEVIDIAESIIGSTDALQMGVDVSSIISFSIGIMFNQKKTDDLDDILLRCDVAMYQAKKNGKGKYIIYNEIEQKVAYQMLVNKEKNTALANEQFKIYLQPRMNMTTSEMDGVEAGIYWEHPKDGVRSPEEFIDILEEDDFIVTLENRMFHKLCSIMSKWNKTLLEKLTVSMRMSKKHLFRKNFAGEILRELEVFGINSERICICVSEIDSHPTVIETINKLKKEGLSIGCSKSAAGEKSSLINVNDHLADYWILEKSMVTGLTNDRTYAVLGTGVISLARDLNIQIYAKGVSSDEEIQSLSISGCDMAVGEMFGGPMKPAEFTEYGNKNIKIRNKAIVYEFNNTLSDTEGQNEGRFITDGVGFTYDETLERNVVAIPGENYLPLDNTIEFPRSLMELVDFSISISIKPNKLKLWQSIFYVDYANGFISIMPSAWDGVVMFRVKEVLYEDEWHDAMGHRIPEGEWSFITVTYNHKKKESILYVNGKCMMNTLDVPMLKKPRRVVIGGDLWQGTFDGSVGHFIIKDYVMSRIEVENEFDFYMGHKNIDNPDKD